ncbi:hypothetical protein LTS18_009871, partial [Coniosporium uncinatum]
TTNRSERPTRSIHASRNGLLAAAITAYSSHHHLIFRPEDVWFAILTQLSFFVNAHPSACRNFFFVQHDGVKKVKATWNGPLTTLPVERVIHSLSATVDANLRVQKDVDNPHGTKDSSRRRRRWRWWTPDFSTTTPEDETVAAVILLGSAQKHFTYEIRTSCGLPSATFLGEQADYASILRDKVSLLDELAGSEPRLAAELERWTALLRTVVQNLVESFADSDDERVRRWWGRIVQRGGSGTPRITGWITAFAFWDEHGALLHEGAEEDDPGGWGVDWADYLDPEFDEEEEGKREEEEYAYVETSRILAGFVSVPVKIVDEWGGGGEGEGRMVAGSVGVEGLHGGEGLGKRGEKQGEMDTVRPVTGWWMYNVEKGEEGVVDGRRREIGAEELWKIQSVE